MASCVSKMRSDPQAAVPAPVKRCFGITVLTPYLNISDDSRFLEEHFLTAEGALPRDTGIEKLGENSKALLCPVNRLSSIKQMVVDEYWHIKVCFWKT